MTVELSKEQIEFVRHTLQSKICHDSHERWQYNVDRNTRCVEWKDREMKTCETIIKQLKDAK
jgi:hypothetical protein